VKVAPWSSERGGTDGGWWKHSDFLFWTTGEQTGERVKSGDNFENYAEIYGL